MTESKIPADKNSQLERFKEAAKLTGTDDSEERFDLVLKKVAKPAKPAREAPPDASSRKR